MADLISFFWRENDWLPTTRLRGHRQGHAGGKIQFRGVLDLNEVVKRRLNQIAEKLKEETQDKIANQFFINDKGGGVAKANREARNIISQRWKSIEGRLSVICGKKVISELSCWSQRKYKVSLSAAAIVRHMIKQEISKEVIGVLKAIERRKSFVDSE